MPSTTTAPQAVPGDVIVIVLASGRGERFLASGGTTHKLRALLAGKPVLEHTLDAARASGLRWHVENADHPGMGDSIAAAVRANAQAAGWLILPGDLPLVRPETLRRVAQALLTSAGYALAEVVMPMYHGERGHPVGFSAACGPALMALQGDKGAATVVRMHKVHAVKVDDVGCVADVDTVDALRAVSALHHHATSDTRT